jgi:hypothetical protein
VEDFDVPTQAGVHNLQKESLPLAGLANDLLESADLSEIDHCAVFKLPNGSSPRDAVTREKKAGKIYKLLRVFLI